jgi:hypothetical protein
VTRPEHLNPSNTPAGRSTFLHQIKQVYSPSGKFRVGIQQLAGYFLEGNIILEIIKIDHQKPPRATHKRQVHDPVTKPPIQLPKAG